MSRSCLLLWWHAWHMFMNRWWCFMWYFILNVSIYLWVWMRPSICILLRLVCIWWYIRLHAWMCFYGCILLSCGMLAFEYNWVMTLFVSMLRDVSMLVFSEVVEYLYMCSWVLCQCMMTYGFTLRYVNILVIPKVV